METADFFRVAVTERAALSIIRANQTASRDAIRRRRAAGIG